MNKDDLLKGALLSLAHSASLLEAAARLYSEGRDASCFVLATSAREELGRFVLLTEKGRSLSPDDTVNAAVLRKGLDDHIDKLRAGQTTVPLPMPLDWVEDWRRAIESQDAAALEALQPQLELVTRSVRRREPHDTHQRRQQSQYVDPQADGSWSTPDSITIEDVRVALMGTAAGIANTLIGIQSAQDLRIVAAEANLPLPNIGEFTTRVFSMVAQRGA